MRYIGRIPSLPDPSQPRGLRGRRLTHQLAQGLAPALLVAALGCGEDADSPTAPDEAARALDITPAHALSFRQISAGAGSHSCGVTTDQRAFCWGINNFGQLGDGTTTNRLTPVPVTGGLQFRQVSAGGVHTCGLTTDNRAFCWGSNDFGKLGDGSTIRQSLSPVEVAGGRRFRQLSTFHSHTCAVNLFDRAFCWGENFSGQIGDGTAGEEFARRTPVRVSGGLPFRQVSTGEGHTCGVTTSDRALCWGQNVDGRLGDGTTQVRLTPVAVVGGLRFRQVSAGDAHTCGATTGNRAFCWGGNFDGRLGDGTTQQRLRPRLVVGGLEFRRVSAGGHTCGVTVGDRAYCWGANFLGQLGDGTTTDRLRPRAVVGDRRFDQVRAGRFHTCGVNLFDRAFCWGRNNAGQVGDGTTTNRSTPVRVAPPA